MKDQDPTQSLPEDTAQFLDNHPGFSPVLSGEDAVICGFQVGQCFLSIADMQWLFATRSDSLLVDLAAWTERTRRVPDHGQSANP